MTQEDWVLNNTETRILELGHSWGRGVGNEAKAELELGHFPRGTCFCAAFLKNPGNLYV